MGMFAAAGYADNGLCLEGYVQTVAAEDFPYHDAGFQFIVCCLQGIGGEEPVQFQLFAYIKDMAVVIDFGFDAAYFFVTHFYMEAPGIQFFDGLFHGGTDVAAHALPVLFLEALGNGQVLYRFLFAGGFHPEFKFRARGKYDILDFREGEVFHALHGGAEKHFLQFSGYVFAGVFQDGAGVNKFSVMDKEAGNPQGAYGTSVFFHHIIIIIIHIPVDRAVGHHVYPCIVQGSDIHEYYGRTIGLHCFAGEEIFVVFHENLDGDLFIGIIACQVNAYERHEPDFRMLRQQGKNPFFTVLAGRNAVQ